MKKLSLEDILRMPFKRAQKVMQKHKAAFDERDYDEIAEIAPLHVLKLKLLENYDEFFNNVLVESLKERTGDIDGSIIRLLRDHPGDIPTFEAFNEYGRDNLFTVCSILPQNVIAKTFTTIFSDKKRFNNAYKAYNLIRDIKERAEEEYDDRENPDHAFVRDILSRLKPVKPKYGKNNVLAVTFVDSKDMKQEMVERNLGIDERIGYLKEVSDIYLTLAVFGDKYKGLSNGGLIARLKKVRKGISEYDHERTFMESIYGRLGIEFPKEFHNILKEKLFDVINKEKKRFSKGDCLPQNEMVQHGRNLNEGGKDSRLYSPVDLEFACFDAVQSPLVELWSKSKIFDYKGDSLTTKDGRKAEEVLIDNSYNTFKKLLEIAGFRNEAEEHSKERFVKAYNLLKIEDYMFWAVRYDYYSKNLDAKKKEEHRLDARYYYTLAVKEMVKQGLIDGSGHESLRPFNEIFGEPLKENSADSREITLEYIANRSDPHMRTFSSFKTGMALDPEKEIEGMAKEYVKKMRNFRIRRGLITAGAILGGVLATGTGGLLLKEYMKRKQEEREKMLKLVTGYYDGQVENQFRGFMESILDGRLKDRMRPVDKEYVVQEARKNGISEYLVLEIINANDMYNPYRNMKEHNGVVILDRSRIDPNEERRIDYTDLDFRRHVREDISRLRDVLVAYGVNLSNPRNLNDPQEMMKFENALFDYLAPEHMKQEIDRFGGGLEWKEDWRILTEGSGIYNDVMFITHGAIDKFDMDRHGRWGRELP